MNLGLYGSSIARSCRLEGAMLGNFEEVCMLGIDLAR